MTGSADWDIVNGIGFTALAVAAARAVESRRPAPLLRDPYAEAFVHAAPLQSPLPTTPEAADSGQGTPWGMIGEYVAVRSRFFDDFFAAAVPGGPLPGDAGIRQAVILAAGLDTRAYRLRWPDGMTVYEVDTPLILSFKEKVLAGRGARAAASRCTVAADLLADWPAALRAAGFDPGQPTAWLAEGLLMYLADEAKASLLSAVQALSAPGSQIAVDHVISISGDIESNAAFRKMVRDTDFAVDVDALWPDDHEHDPVAWLRAGGWSAEASPITAVAGRYGRPLSPTLPEGMLTALLVTARKPGQPARGAAGHADEMTG